MKILRFWPVAIMALATAVAVAGAALNQGVLRYIFYVLGAVCLFLAVAILRVLLREKGRSTEAEETEYVPPTISGGFTEMRLNQQIEGPEAERLWQYYVNNSEGHHVITEDCGCRHVSIDDYPTMPYPLFWIRCAEHKHLPCEHGCGRLVPPDERETHERYCPKRPAGRLHAADTTSPLRG